MSGTKASEDDITIKHLENMLVEKINLIKELLGEENK